MRKSILVWLLALSMALTAMPAFAWGPGAHAVIGLGVARERDVTFPNRYLMLQGVYGTGLPDFALTAREPPRSALFAATHDAPGYLRVAAVADPMVLVDRAFVFGWLTHNQVWGADYYAHIVNPLPSILNPLPSIPELPGYVVWRAQVLAAAQGISEAAAHDYVEAAIDLLLDQQFPRPSLAYLLREAAAKRHPRIPWLLGRAYGDMPGASREIIANLEARYRHALSAYGLALYLPTGDDDKAFAVGLALRWGLTLEKSATCLAAAKALCQEPGAHYHDALAATVALVAGGPWP